MEKKTLKEIEMFETFIERCQNLINSVNPNHNLNLDFRGTGVASDYDREHGLSGDAGIPSSIEEWMDLYKHVKENVKEQKEDVMVYLDIYDNDMETYTAYYTGFTITFSQGSNDSVVVSKGINYAEEIKRIANESIERGLGENDGGGIYNFEISLPSSLRTIIDGKEYVEGAILQVYPFEEGEPIIYLLAFTEEDYNEKWECNSIDFNTLYENEQEIIYDLFVKEYDSKK